MKVLSRLVPAIGVGMLAMTALAAPAFASPAAGAAAVNAGSGSVSGYTAGVSGRLTAPGNASTDAGTVDASAAGGFLYVQAGAAGIVAL